MFTYLSSTIELSFSLSNFKTSHLKVSFKVSRVFSAMLVSNQAITEKAFSQVIE
ncbi:MAG: hypothetical protein LBD88_01510 [Candidatus Peribacteria bacterium]|jgi:hypothetical protein|nr:hypothetical protein [Candidatus Peribacteria bacterium]